MKISPNAPPVLVSQISAYQQNYFRVASLIEDSQTKATALVAVQEMEKKIQDVRRRLFSFGIFITRKFIFSF